MFSSLPSASKIYVSSSKPRQKSASSAKKKRKKVSSNLSHRESFSDDAVISLVSCNQDSSEVSPSKTSECRRSSRDSRFFLWEGEDSSSEISHRSVKNDKNAGCSEKQSTQHDVEALPNDLSENLDEELEERSGEQEQKKGSSNQLDEEEPSEPVDLNKRLPSEVENSNEPVQLNTVSDADDSHLQSSSDPVELTLKNVLPDASGDKIDTSGQVHSEEQLVTVDLMEEKFEMDMTFEELEASIQSEPTKASLCDEPLMEMTAKETCIHSEVDDELLAINAPLVQGDVKQDGFNENCDINEERNENVSDRGEDGTHQALEDVVKSDRVDYLVDFKQDDSSTTVDDSSSKDFKVHATEDVVMNMNNNCNYPTIDVEDSDCHNSYPGNSHTVQGYINNELEMSTINKDNLQNEDKFDFSVRVQSPEQSELSGTESILYEPKATCVEILKENSFPKLVESADDHSTFNPDLLQEEYSNISQSCSDLGKDDLLPSIPSRCSSMPDDLNAPGVVPKFVDSTVSLATTCVDKETFTSDLGCDNCGGESLENVNSKSTSGYLTASKSISASLDKISSGNALPRLAMMQARARSYVFGSMGPSGALLGNEELSRFFPDNQVTIFVGTWNMNGHDPPKNIDDFLLPLDISTLPDIYAIGVQESTMQSRSEWEILLQTTLGPSHVLFTSCSLGVLHLCIFLRRDLIWFCSEPEEATVATRPGSMVKTKGAIAICFMFFGTSLLFVNSHLTAHEQKLKERFSDYEKIISSLDFPKSTAFKNHCRDKDVTSRFDCVFWCGDLNFRVIRDRPSVLSFVEDKVRRPRPSCSFLVKHDQLHKAMIEGQAFHGFKEGVIQFIPSYKFDVGTSTFNSSKLRVPSYTDRILYRSKEKSSISCLYYNAVPDILTSDHKPVFAVFKVTIKPGRDNVPLAAGMFKRDVYLEAIRRRSRFLEARHNQGHSSVCNVM